MLLDMIFLGFRMVKCVSIGIRMSVIDLSIPLFDSMPVFPGDPEVKILEVHTLEKEGWRLSEMTLTTHVGTHVNVPSHMIREGKNLDEIDVSSFFGPAAIYRKGIHWNTENGLLFRDQNIDLDLASMLIRNPPKFVGLSNTFNFEVPLEKMLLEHGIISFESLANTEQLPDTFTFYGVPLKITGADGSPVRAFAVVE